MSVRESLCNWSEVMPAMNQHGGWRRDLVSSVSDDVIVACLCKCFMSDMIYISFEYRDMGQHNRHMFEQHVLPYDAHNAGSIIFSGETASSKSENCRRMIKTLLKLRVGVSNSGQKGEARNRSSRFWFLFIPAPAMPSALPPSPSRSCTSPSILMTHPHPRLGRSRKLPHARELCHGRLRGLQMASVHAGAEEERCGLEICLRLRRCGLGATVRMLVRNRGAYGYAIAHRIACGSATELGRAKEEEEQAGRARIGRPAPVPTLICISIPLSTS
ncbi:hypothetical protein B0H11DRAFT_2263557 [Mycena galericulata]|nr:hypothetical protein B0H11DRAFT_2263557 [Mycena galericulata]